MLHDFKRTLTTRSGRVVVFWSCLVIYSAVFLGPSLNASSTFIVLTPLIVYLSSGYLYWKFITQPFANNA